jgi:anti-sigma factor ChrR (cupin superfamily)
MTRKFFGHSEDSAASAALFALGSLCGEEKTAFEQHVRGGCEICEQDLVDLAGVVNNLALAVPPIEPSAAVRQRLLDSTRIELRRSGGPELLAKSGEGVLLQQSGLLIARSADLPWEQVAPGISRKILALDSGRSYSTSLIRAEAGAIYPRHRHAGVEELLVLEGDLRIHGVVMRTGDYCRAEPGSLHEETFTEGGCILLQIASQLDQIEG